MKKNQLLIDNLRTYPSKPRESRRTPRTRRHKPKDITNKGTRNILYRNQENQIRIPEILRLLVQPTN